MGGELKIITTTKKNLRFLSAAGAAWGVGTAVKLQSFFFMLFLLFFS